MLENALEGLSAVSFQWQDLTLNAFIYENPPWIAALIILY